MVRNLCVVSGLILSLVGAGFLVAGCETESSPEASESGGMTLTPTSVSFDASVSTNVVFTVSGGLSPYEWSLGDSSLGSLVIVGYTAVYTSGVATGTTEVTVLDSEGSSVSATVTQE